MKLPSAMNTSRVQEAIASLAGHVEFAHDIAGSIKPISLVKPVLEPVPVILVPRIESVDVSGTKCDVQGKHFTEDITFKLVSVRYPDQVITAAISKLHSEFCFTATLDKLPAEGAYLAWVIDKEYRGDFLHLQIRKSAPASSNISCSVVAVVPNEAVVVVLDTSKEFAFLPKKIFVEVTSEGDRFPDDVTFAAPDHSLVSCGKAILTSDPKIRVIPMQIHSAPDQSKEIVIEVTSKISGVLSSTFTFNLLRR
jgi:hypothetical protein